MEHYWKIVNSSTGEVVHTIKRHDPESPNDEKAFMGLCHKVDFDRFYIQASEDE